VLEIAESFWKLVSKYSFPELKNFALKMHSTFRSTYVCESTFSTMRQVKSKNRNRMADKTQDDILRLAATTTGVDKGTTVSEKIRPQASH